MCLLSAVTSKKLSERRSLDLLGGKSRLAKDPVFHNELLYLPMVTLPANAALDACTQGGHRLRIWVAKASSRREQFSRKPQICLFEGHLLYTAEKRSILES